MAKSTRKGKREDSKNVLAVMDGKSPRSSKSGHHRRRSIFPKFNRRAIFTVAGVVALVAALYYPVRLIQNASLRRSALGQVRELKEQGKVDLAMVTLRHYLGEWPDDLSGLSLMGELVADSATSGDQVIYGSQILDRLLRLDLDSDSPERQLDRKRLVQLYLRIGDMNRVAGDRAASAANANESRYKVAYKLAELRLQKFKPGADDAESHRLVGLCLEKLAATGEPGAEASALKEYQKALRRDPGDVATSERLAALRLAKKDRAGADQILDDMIRSKPKSIEGRVARALHFIKTGREDRAKVEAEMASRLAPTDPKVRLLAAQLALGRNDLAAARRHCEAISKDEKLGTRASVLLGQISLAERKPDEAIKLWRQGLARSSGTDAELTWRLAQLLIRMGRIADARPLMEQFRRLAGKDDAPMYRLLQGLLKVRTGRPVAAKDDLLAARDEVPDEWKVDLELALGRCLETAGEAGEARVAYEKARDAAPTSSAPRLSLARLLRANDPSKAADELESGIRQARPDAALLAELARVRLVQQLALPPEERNWSAAEAAIARGRRVKADDPSLILANAEVLAASGRVDAAITSLEEATKGPARSSQEVWLKLAEFLGARGRSSDALAALERGEAPGSAEEPAPLRIARARSLVRLGRGRDAIALLAVAPASIPLDGRADLAKARAEILRDLGNRPGARAACAEWAALAPDQPGPGLFLVEMGLRPGDHESLELGLELLRKVGGDEEPYALASQALAILLPGQGGDEADVSQLDQAELLGAKLVAIAPSLPFTSLIHALILERSRGFEEAIVEYKNAMRGDSSGIALSRLVGLLTRLERFAEIDELSKDPKRAAVVARLSLASALVAKEKGKLDAGQPPAEPEPDGAEPKAIRPVAAGEPGKAGDGEAALRHLLDRNPERPQNWMALVASQAASGDKSAAAATIARAASEYKGERPWLLMAALKILSGDRAGASKLYDEGLAAHPDDVPTLRIVSEYFESEGKLDATEGLLRRARKLDPKAPWAPRRLALVLSARGTTAAWAEAWEMVRPGGPDSGDSPDDRLIRATILERSPDPSRRAEAVTTLSALVDDLNPGHPASRAARIRLAQVFLASGDAAGAARVIAPPGESSDETDPTVLTLAVEALARTNQPGPARTRLDRLEAIEPDTPRTVACRAQVLKIEGDEAGAASALEDAAAAAEKLPDGEARMAFFLEQLSRLGLEDAADRVARRLAELWPRHAWSLAGLLAAKGQVAEALDACRKAVEAGAAREPLQVVANLGLKDKYDPAQADRAREIVRSIVEKAPTDSASLMIATSMLRHIKRPEDEVKLYRKALEADPANNFARNNLAWTLSEDMNRPAEGLVEIDQAIARFGPAPRLGDTRGVILTRLGRVDEAINELSKAIAAEPNGLRQLHLARSFAKANRADDRRKSLQAARDLGLSLDSFEPDEKALVAEKATP